MADREIAARRRTKLEAERTAAQAAGEEYAVSLNLKFRWNAGAPMPHLFSDGSRAFVLFLQDVPRVEQDERSRGADGRGSAIPALGVAEFVQVYSVKFGGPNDEVLNGHPLYGKGLDFYEAHTVVNSRWIAEEERINSVHPNHRGGWHKSLQHYVFTFHDETLECLAEDVRTEQLDCSFPEAVVRLATRFVNKGQ